MLLFDGIRLDTSRWRQGPNPYFFTLDSRSFISSTDIAVPRELSRGQHLAGSTSLTGGGVAEGALSS